MTEMIERVRAAFPALGVTDEGRRRIYFDNPAGTQVPRQVIDRVTSYYTRSNANTGGGFVTSRATMEIAQTARTKLAAFFNASSADEIVIGRSMTALTFHIAQALQAEIRTGDEILVTHMDHDANVTPWLRLAERTGAIVKWLPFDRETTRYDMQALDDLVTPRTKIAAVNYASNITGTINDVATIVKRVQAVGGLSYVDAVQYAPHGVIDVQALGCDFLACSPYKFYGPHVGVLWGRKSWLERLAPQKLRVSTEALPSRYMLGTAAYELIAGTLGALEYYEWLGEAVATDAHRAAAGAGPAGAINAAKLWMQEHESKLALHLIERLKDLPAVRIHGLTAAAEMPERVSTISLTVKGKAPKALADSLAAENIFTWSGDNYALDLIAWLGLAEGGGVLRIGPVHYNTINEVDQTADALAHLIG